MGRLPTPRRPGAIAVAAAFVTPSLLIVIGVGALYAHYAGLPVMRWPVYGMV